MTAESPKKQRSLYQYHCDKEVSRPSNAEWKCRIRSVFAHAGIVQSNVQRASTLSFGAHRLTAVDAVSFWLSEEVVIAWQFKHISYFDIHCNITIAVTNTTFMASLVLSHR